MSTRGAYVFEDASNGVSVYRHSDNYPSGASEAIENAKKQKKCSITIEELLEKIRLWELKYNWGQ